MTDGTTIVIGGDARRIADALGARFVSTPDAGSADGWEAWRETLSGGPTADEVIVALAIAERPYATISSLDVEAWVARAETPLLHWMIALGAAALACADGGAIVAVVDGPAPLDSAGLAPEAAVAEGVAALVRSLALSEGKRGVRVNSVVTPFRLVGGTPIPPVPPLPGFPGSFEQDVLGGVRLMLSRDAAYVSGHHLAADRGRSW